MLTMVEYTDSRPARNEYPYRIVSPTRPGPCCSRHMAFVGEEIAEGQAIFRYKRCVRCGYTVRCILREVPDPQVVRSLRDSLAVAFSRLDYEPALGPGPAAVSLRAAADGAPRP
jgi:hypothetical protein